MSSVTCTIIISYWRRVSLLLRIGQVSLWLNNQHLLSDSIGCGQVNIWNWKGSGVGVLLVKWAYLSRQHQIQVENPRNSYTRCRFQTPPHRSSSCALYGPVSDVTSIDIWKAESLWEIFTFNSIIAIVARFLALWYDLFRVGYASSFQRELVAREVIQIIFTITWNIRKRVYRVSQTMSMLNQDLIGYLLKSWLVFISSKSVKRIRSCDHICATGSNHNSRPSKGDIKNPVWWTSDTFTPHLINVHWSPQKRN